MKTNVKDINVILNTWKCINRKENYEKEIDEDLTKKFENTYRLCEADINKLCLMLEKGVHPYQLIDDWEKSGLNMDDTTEEVCKNTKRVWEGFNKTNPS